MKNYRSTEERFEYSDVMMPVYRDLLGRIKPQYERESTFTGPDPDGKTPFLDVFDETVGEAYPVRLAKAIVKSWTDSAPILRDGDILAGATRPKRPVFEHFSFGVQIDRGLLDDPAYRDRKEELLKRIADRLDELLPLRMDHVLNEARARFSTPEHPTAYEDLVAYKLWWVGGFQGHTVPNYDILMKKGIGGVHSDVMSRLAEESDPHKRETLEACRIVLEGMRDWILLQADAAGVKAEAQSDRVLKARYFAVAENCRKIAFDAPSNYYEAAQLTWFYSLWDWVDCVGRADQYLFPFFEKAAAEDRAFAEDVTASLMLKFMEHGIHNMTVGGVKPEDGSDGANDLTFLMLQIARRNHFTHPRMSIRVSENSDPALMELAVKMWSEGMSDPTVASDTLIIPSFIENYGVDPKDAMNYSLLGCQELEIPGKSNFGCEDGLFNLAKVLELTLNDGKSRFDNEVQIGLKTGHITDYEDFEDLWAAFESQVKFFTKHFVDLCNLGQEVRAANYSKLVKTPFTEACVERGLSLDEGGAVYNLGCVETAGVAVVADSMTAIKKLVFEEKVISKETLEKALAANFEGYEKERQMLINMAPKFGNDEDEVDLMAKRLLDFFWSEIKKYRSVRGDVFSGACSLLAGGIAYGMNTWATPDGRLTGEPLGNSIGPKPGNDKSGLTAMLNSCEKLPLGLGLGGTTCNVLIPTAVTKTEKMRGDIAALMTSFLKNGGQLSQITTASLEDMIDAKTHPEAHGDLIVRIGGFSVRFCELTDVEQDEIISRYSKE